jgi:hypothetical protein
MEVNMDFEQVCDAAARARNDITEWLRQFDLHDDSDYEMIRREDRKVVVGGLTEMLVELTAVLTKYVDGANKDQAAD